MYPFSRFHWYWLGCAMLALFLLFLTLHTPAASKGGNDHPALDPTFPGAGTADVVMGDQLSPFDLITYDSGKILTFASEGGIYQHLATGQPDLTFGTNGRVFLSTAEGSLYPHRVVRDSEGRFIVAGMWWPNGPTPELGQDAFTAARILPNGTLDTTFGTEGYVRFPSGNNQVGTVRRVLQQPDGKIVILSTGSGNGASVLYRLLENGTPDPTFEGDGSVNLPVGVVQDIALQPNGILIAGIDYEATPAGYLRRQNLSDGSVDFTFGNNGTAYVAILGATDTSIHTIDIAPSNKIVVAGNTFMAGESHFFAAQLTANGVLDATFNEDGIAPVQFPNNVPNGSVLADVIATADGVLLVGTAGSGGLAGRTAALARLTPGGDIDTTFAEDGFFYNYLYRLESATVGVVNADGDYLIGGERFGVAVLKLDPTGVAERTYGDTGYFSIGSAEPTMDGRLLSQSDGKIVVFARYGDFPSRAYGTFMVRTTADGILDDTYGNHGISIVPNPTGDAEPAVGATVDAANRTILAGYNGSNSGPTTAVLTRVNPSGGVDTTFGTNGFLTFGIPNREQAHAITMDPASNFLVAGRLSSDTAPQALIVRRLLPDGTLDTTFGTDGATIIPDCPTEFYVNITQHTSIHLLTDGNLLVFALCNRQTTGISYELYRLNANGILDTTYGENGVVVLPFLTADLSIADNGTVTTLSRRAAAQAQYWRITQYTPSGDPDPTFGTNGVVEHIVPGLTQTLVASALAQHEDGTWILLGYNTSAWYAGDIQLAAIRPDGTLDPTFGTNGLAQLDLVDGDFPRDFVIRGNTTLMSGSFVSNRHSADVALTLARLQLRGVSSPTPTATSVPPTPTPTSSPTPQSRTLYLPLTQRGE